MGSCTPSKATITGDFQFKKKKTFHTYTSLLFFLLLHFFPGRLNLVPHFIGMGVIWWGTGDRIYDAPPPPPHTHTLFGIEKNNIFQYLFAFYGNFYWTYPDHIHILTLYLHSDILSMYSIQRMSGNRNQSHNDLHFSKIFRHLPPPPPNVASRLGYGACS